MPKKKNTISADAEVYVRPIISGSSVVAPDGGEIRSKEFLYRSGRQILCEALTDGVYGLRYRGSSGQIEPDDHIGPVSPSFLVRSRRAGQPEHDAVSGWTLEGSGRMDKCPLPELCGADPDADTVYSVRLSHKKAGLCVTVYTLLDGSDFIERWLEIENTADTPAALTDVCPYRGRVWENPAGRGGFSAAYTHGGAGGFYADPASTDVRLELTSGRPCVWLENHASGEWFVLEYGWGGGWKIAAETESVSGGRLSLSVSAGMLPAAEAARDENGGSDGHGSAALYVLSPGEKVMTPAVHIALLRESEDRIAQICHEHVRTMVMPTLPDGVRAAEIEADHRAYLSRHESEEGIKRDIDAAAACGAEMYVLDAGWSGGGDIGRWHDSVGDWTPGVWLKNGIKPLLRYAHDKKMRFGLWCGIETAGPASRLAAEHPEWLCGRTVDLSVPDAETHCLGELCRIAEEYRPDMLRIAVGDESGLPRSGRYGFMELSDWRHRQAFCRMMRKVRRRYPDTELQAIDDAGRLDYMTLSLFHSAGLSRLSRQPESVDILGGISYMLPPERILSGFGTLAPDIPCDGDIDSQLRCAVMARPALMGTAPSPDRLSPWLDRRIKHSLDLFRSVLRPILDGCLVYHHKPLSARASGGDVSVIEYASPDGTRSAAAVFRLCGSAASDGDGIVSVRLKSVSPGHSYSVIWDSAGDRARMSGADIMRWGIPVRAAPGSSEMLILRRED